MSTAKSKRVNCEALEIVVEAAKGYVRALELRMRDKYVKNEELDTAIFMMQKYIDENKF